MRISQYVIRSGASLLRNLLTGIGTIRSGEGVIATSQGQGTIRAAQDF